MFTFPKLKYLVVGTGRCGTVSVSRLLTQAGIPCGHESIFDSQGKAAERLKTNVFEQSFTFARDGWKLPLKIEADSSYMAVPFLESLFLKKTIIIHLVRNPLQVISSFVYGVKHFQENEWVKEWDDFIELHLSSIKDFDTPIEKATHFYIEWNKMIKADVFHRIEDDPRDLLEKLSLPINNLYTEKANSFPRSVTIALEDIPKGMRDELVSMSLQYGYDL